MMREKRKARKMETYHLEGVLLRVVGMRDKRKPGEVLACPHCVRTPRVDRNFGVWKYLVLGIPSGLLVVDACNGGHESFDLGCIIPRRSGVSVLNTNLFPRRRFTVCLSLSSPK
jgi:hypothetical protein